MEDEENEIEEITDPLTILNRERDLQKLMFSNSKSIKPDVLDKLKSTLQSNMIDLAMQSK